MHVNKILSSILALFFFLGLAACNDSNSSSNNGAAAEEYLEAQNFSGTVLIKENGVDVLRKGFGYSDKANQQQNIVSTHFRIGSLSKAFTALCIVQLQNEDLLGYDDLLSSYMPDYPEGDKITIRHLLSHQSGLDDYLKHVDEEESYTPQELLLLIKDRPLLFEPGNGFFYSNTNYVLLGCIIESISGYDYASYVEIMVAKPLGMFNTEYGSNIITGQKYAKGYVNSSQNELANYHDLSIPYAAGALSSNLDDMEIWALILRPYPHYRAGQK